MSKLLKTLEPTKAVDIFDGSDEHIKTINFMAGLVAAGAGMSGSGNLIVIPVELSECDCGECKKLVRVRVCKVIYDGQLSEINEEWKERKGEV